MGYLDDPEGFYYRCPNHGKVTEDHDIEYCLNPNGGDGDDD